MVGKSTKILVVCPAHNMQRELEFTHAERLLSMKDNGGWVLPANSNFEFIDHAIRRKQNKKGNPRKEKESND